jgi:hypothetical protein
MQFGQQQQQQQLRPQQQPQLGVSWQQQPAVGLLGQSASAAVAGSISTESFMLQWQQLQQAHSQQQLEAAAAAAAGLAAKAAAVAAAASNRNSHQFGSSTADYDLAASGPGYNCQGVMNGQQLRADDLAVGQQQQAGHRDSTSTAGRATSSRRVSSADDIVMFVMEDGGSGLTPTKRGAQGDEAAAAAAAAAAARLPHSSGGNLAGDNLDQLQLAGRPPAQQQRVKQLAGRLELIASSPLELCPIEEQPPGVAAGEVPLVQHTAADLQAARQVALMQPVLPAVQLLGGRQDQQQQPLQQQQQQDDEQEELAEDDLELQEAEVMTAEHPGDWDPLYSDEQLLDEQLSPAGIAQPLLAAAALAPPGPGAVAVAPAASSHPGLHPHQLGLMQQQPSPLQQPAGPGPLFAGSIASGALHVVRQVSTSSTIRSRRDSLMQVRAMSVELPGDDVLAAGGVVDPEQELVGGAVGGQGSPDLQETELQITLGDSWSFRHPAAVNRLDMQQQQQQQLNAPQAAVAAGTAAASAADLASRNTWLAGSRGQQQQQQQPLHGQPGSGDMCLGLRQSCQQQQPAGGSTGDTAEAPGGDDEDAALLFLQRCGTIPDSA